LSMLISRAQGFVQQAASGKFNHLQQCGERCKTAFLHTRTRTIRWRNHDGDTWPVASGNPLRIATRRQATVFAVEHAKKYLQIPKKMLHMHVHESQLLSGSCCALHPCLHEQLSACRHLGHSVWQTAATDQLLLHRMFHTVLVYPIVT
jgi:hypothetical protein